MRLEEIIEIPPRDEYNDQFINKFNEANTIAKLGNFELKKNISEYGDISYGLFNVDMLVSYLSLSNEIDFFQIGMISVQREFRGQGYATYLMDYAINNDNLIIASDSRQTPEAKELWLSCIRNGRFKISQYNVNTKVKSKINNPWDGTEDTILISEHHLEEMKNQFEENETRRERFQRKEYLYGPGTSSMNFWNP